MSGSSRADNAEVEGAGVGVPERLLVHVLNVDRLPEYVQLVVVFSLSEVLSEHVLHLWRLLRISALLDSDERDGDVDAQVLHAKEPS